MNVDQIFSGIQNVLKSAGGRLSLQDSQGFGDTLNLGQIIKGQVLRHYEQNRYLVDFSGHEKVVDSSVPLRTDEILYGKVVALGDKIEIQRVRTEKSQIHSGQTSDANETPLLAQGFFGSNQKIVKELFARYQAVITPDQTEAIVRQGLNASDINAAAKAGLVLAKLGLTATPELMDVMISILTARNTRSSRFALPENMLMLTTDVRHADAAAVPLANIPPQIFANMLAEIAPKRLQDPPTDVVHGPLSALLADDKEVRGPSGDLMEEGSVNLETGNNAPLDMAKWLLNVQSEGTVEHRVGTIPFWFHDRLVEIDIAVFDQRRNAKSSDKVRHRQIVFTLNLEHLGRVVMNAKISGNHIGLQISTDNPQNTEVLASHLAELRGVLRSGGWNVDEMTYAFTDLSERSEVVASVVEHIINQDSLNQLI